MRLIDADALLDKVQDYGEGQERLMLIDTYWVRKAPTIERPHGEWKHDTNGWFCSACEHGWEYVKTPSDFLSFNFCPNCGADMRVKTDLN